jgi:hypothetical protein
MIDACDPDADMKTLRKLIRMNTGENLKLTRDEICQVYDDIQGGKLPLPPLVMNSTRSYLIDKKSPLTAKDYEQYFNSSTKKSVLKRFAKKVGLKNIDALTKQDLTDAIGTHLMYMKVREPVKIARRRIGVKKETLALPMNNTGAVNNLGLPVNNTGAVNNLGLPVNNTGAVNNLGLPKNEGFPTNNLGNTGTVNNLGLPTNNLGNTGTVNNLGLPTDNLGNTGLPKNQPNSKISIPKNGLFKKEQPPAFIRNYKPKNRNQKSQIKFNNVFENKKPFRNTSEKKNKPGFFAGIFGKKKPVTNRRNNVSPPVVPNRRNNVSPPVVPNRRNNVGPVVPNRRNNVSPPLVPNRRNNMGPVVPNRRNNMGPVVPNRRNNVGPVVPNRRNNVGPVVPNRRNNMGSVVPNRANISSVKAKFKTDLKSLKKLKPAEVNMFLARVRTAENLNTIFDDARAMNQKRYEQEVQNAEAKAQRAKTEQERKAAQAEQLRLEKEQEAARIKAQKNAARLENEERRAEITRRERAIKNAKTAFSGDLATLKKLSKSERASYLSQVRTIDNINAVFEKARAVDQQRYDQELVNTEAKVQRAKTEQERKLAQAEQRRIEKEQQNAERSAEKKAKALQNQELRAKQRELKLEEQKRRANIQAEERALTNTAKLEERKRRTIIQSREKAFKNAKNSLKRSLADLKLTPQQRNGLVARVKTIENIDDIFEEGRTLSRQRFNQNLANAEAKKQKARTEKERKEAEAEQRRLVKEQENTRIRAQKNAMRMRNLERKIEEETRRENIANIERVKKTKIENIMRQANVNRAYLNKYAVGKNIDTLNVNALKQKALKDRELAQLVANLQGTRPVLKYVNNSNYQRLYNNTKQKLEEKKKRGVTNTIEKNLLSIPDVDQVYLKAYAGNTPLNQVNKQALTNKVAKDRKIRNMLEKAKPSTFGKRKVVFIRPENYNAELEKVQSVLDAKNTERLEKNALTRLTTNAAVSANYVKAFAAGKPLANVQLNALKQKRNMDLDVAKLNATDVKTVFGKYQTTVPNTRKLVYIEPDQYNTKKRKAEENLEKRRAAKAPNNVKVPNNAKVSPLNRFKKAARNVGVVETIKKAGVNARQRKEAVSNALTTVTTTNVKPLNRFKKAARNVGVVETIKKAGVNARQRKEAVSNLVSNALTTVTTTNVKPLNRFKKAVRNVGVVETIKKAGVNARQRKEAVSNLVSNALTTVTTTNVKPLNKVNTAEKRRKLLNKISKYTNKRITGFKGRAGNPFRTAEEYNQINAEVNKMIKLVEEEANTKKKVREGVEFKLKQIKGLTNTDVAEFMKKWNTSKNRTIFNQARKRGAGRVAGKEKTEERAKPKEGNNFNASAAMNQLNLAPAKNKLMKKARDEVGRFGGRIGKWDPAIKNAKTDTELTNLEKKLNKKLELRREVQGSKIGPLKKRGHLEKVMQLTNNVGQRRRIFEQQLTNLAQNTKKKELSKYIVGLNIPAENKSRYVKQTNKPGANLNLIRRTVNKQVEDKIAKASKSLVADAIGKIQKKENKEVSNVSKSLVAGAIEKAKKEEAATKIQAAVKGKKNRNAAMNRKRAEFTELAKKTQTNFTRNIAAMKNMKNAFKLRGRIEGAIKRNAEAATKIQAAFRGKKGRNTARRVKLNKAPPNPLFENITPKPTKPSFKAIVQKEKEKRVVNSVKLAAKKTALSRASGSERVKMARNLAPKTQEDVKKVADAVKVFNRQSATSAINRLKKLSQANKTKYKGQIGRADTKARIKEIQESATREDAMKKAEEDRKKAQEAKKKADMEAERVRKMKAKKATREAAERAAESAKKMLTETEKMKAKAKENKKFNNKLAEKRRLLREREAKLEPKKRKPKKKQ